MIGSISHGTMKSEDLLDTFMDYIEIANKERWRELSARFQRDWDNEVETTEDGEIFIDYFLNEDVWEVMEELAPDGYYFGAHIGDGSDFGYWRDEINCD